MASAGTLRYRVQGLKCGKAAFTLIGDEGEATILFDSPMAMVVGLFAMAMSIAAAMEGDQDEAMAKFEELKAKYQEEHDGKGQRAG